MIIFMRGDNELLLLSPTGTQEVVILALDQDKTVMLFIIIIASYSYTISMYVVIYCTVEP